MTLHLSKCREPATTTEPRYPFLARTLRKRNTDKTANIQIDHRLLRRPASAYRQRNKPLPTLPETSEETEPRPTLSETLEEITQIGIPISPRYLQPRDLSQLIPFVESTSSAYSSPSTLVAQEEPAFHRTPEYREYRNSLVEGQGIQVETLIPAQDSPGSTGIDSSNPETSVDRSSVAGIFYRRTQVPVHAIDTLQVIVNNLEAITTEEAFAEYYQPLERALRYLQTALQTLQYIPRQTVQPPRRIYFFAEYLQNQIDNLRAKIINPENLSNPDLDQDIQKYCSCLRAKALHQEYLVRKPRRV